METIRFQFVSVRFTVAIIGLNAAVAVGVPIFPAVVPALVVSPGNKICRRVDAELAITVRGELARLAKVPSVAVIVVVSALRNVVLKVVVETPLENVTPVVYTGVPPGPL